MAEITGMSGPVTKINVLGGVPGAAGVSVTTTELDADGHLLISKSNGTTIDVGKVKFDVTPEVQAAWDGAVAAETEVTTQAGIATTAASDAKDSETKAAASAGVAQAAASTASTARDQAQEARSGAESAAASADAARDQAATSATTASGSANTAALSASSASGSATAAGTSASQAAGSETAAASAAADAFGYAGTASEQAGIAVQAALDATTVAANALPEWDEDAGEYTPASIAAWIKRQRDGKLYGISIPTGLSVACTKTVANTGIANPTPGVIGTPAMDAYVGRGPFFTATVNAYVDADGVPHVTAFKGDATFSLTGDQDVWILAPVLYWRWDDSDASASVLTVTDVNRPGFDPQPKAVLPSGETRPYMLYAKYALSIDSTGTARSVSGAKVQNRNVSHNSLITQCKTASTGYAGKSFADDWYVKAMFLLKYATKNSQSVFAGVTSWNIQTPITVAETGTTRVIIATSQAANIPVGSALMLGSTTTTSPNRNAATSYDIFDGLRVTRKETYDASNTAIYVNAAAAFNTTVGTYLSTTPWNTGACDSLMGDGSPTSRTSGREPFTVQGIELGLGMNEVLGDVILKSDGSTGWQIYVNPDSKNEVTTVNSNYLATGKYNPSVHPDSSTYPMYPDFAGGVLFGTGSGGSTSTGLADLVFYNGVAVAGEREWMSLGDLNNSASAGMWFVSGSGALGGMLWNIGSRLSAVGRAS